MVTPVSSCVTEVTVADHRTSAPSATAPVQQQPLDLALRKVQQVPETGVEDAELDLGATRPERERGHREPGAGEDISARQGQF
jgi:hypothetical protein